MKRVRRWVMLCACFLMLTGAAKGISEGGQADCIHEYTYQENVRRVDDTDGTYGFRADNGETHTGCFDIWKYVVCNDCGEVTDKTRLMQAIVITEKHRFVDGACADCGYSNACRHEHTVNYEERDILYCDSEGAETHSIICNLTHIVDCKDCGQNIEKTYEERVQFTEPHAFSDGVCPDCGQCAHSRFTTERVNRPDGAVQFVQADQTGHSFYAAQYDVSICSDCGEQFDERLAAENSLLTQAHRWEGENGVCVDCGYACGHVWDEDGICVDCGFHCPHLTTAVYTSRKDEQVTRYDAEQHVAVCTEVNTTRCVDCGTALGSGETTGIAVYEPHTFLRGRCSACGECMHISRTTEDLYSDVRVTAADDQTHLIIRDYEQAVICDECHEELERVMVVKGEQISEEHSYEGNICTICGYVSQQIATPGEAEQRTPEPAPVQTPAPIPTATPEPTPDVSAQPEVNPPSESGRRPVRDMTDIEFVPTPEPTAEAPEEMVSALLATVQELEAAGEEVNVEIVGAQEVFDGAVYAEVKTLPATEQILVTLSAIGFDDVVTAAMEALGVTLSDQAASLIEQTNERMAALSEEDRAELEQKIAELFPKTTITQHGVTYGYFVLDLKITVGSRVRVERYGFRYDETLGQWIFVKLDLVSAYTVNL